MKFMAFVVLLAGIALATFATYLALQAAVTPAPALSLQVLQAQRSALAFEAAKAYEENIFSYNDSKHGFQINYFIGMDAVLEPREGVYLELTAGFPGTSGLAIDLFLSRAKTARELMNDAVDGLKAAGATWVTQEEQFIEGRRTYFVEAEGADALTGENMLYRSGFYSCRDPKGVDYFASLKASMPVDLLPELKFVDYILYSFKC